MGDIIQKPWGHEDIWARTDNYVGKILFIKEGHRLSLQHHEKKEETIRVINGLMSLELEGYDGNIKTHVLEASMTRHIPPGTKHRMVAITDVEIVEVSTTELDDIVRHEDDYNRA